MLRKLLLPITLLLCGFSFATMLQPLHAATPLTRATVERLKNQVRLIRKNQPTRAARVSDVMTTGDALSTARSSLADLRFNDGSLARLGEKALFQFVPGTRNFYLSNGTVLLLIPPGQGRTIIRTPSAAAGIRGSALIVRYIDRPLTNGSDHNNAPITLIASLTDSGIEVSTGDGKQTQVLPAGQLAVITQNQIQLYQLDLETLYNTAPMMEGLNLTKPSSTSSDGDQTLAEVRAEIAEARTRQPEFSSDDTVLTNPIFARLNPTSDLNVFTNGGNNDWPNSSVLDLGSPVNPSDVPGLVGDQVRSTQSPVNGNFPGQGNGGQGDLPAQGNGGQGDLPAQGNGGQGDLPGQGNGGQGDLPGQGNGGQGDLPGQGNGGQNGFPGLIPLEQGQFPNQGNGVQADFSEQGNGMQNGFPGRGNGVRDGFPGRGNGVRDGFPGRGNGDRDDFPGRGNGDRDD